MVQKNRSFLAKVNDWQRFEHEPLKAKIDLKTNINNNHLPTFEKQYNGLCLLLGFRFLCVGIIIRL